MSDAISRDLAIRSLASCFDAFYMEDDRDMAIRVIENLPALDAVPVVRCKDCKWFMPGQVCILRNVGVRNDFFCASGVMAILSGGGGGAAD